MEAIAYQVDDVMKAAENDLGTPVTALRADGGITKSQFVMQFQADISNVEVACPSISDTTALGSAFLAGLWAGVWKDTKEISSLCSIEARYSPKMNEDDRRRYVKGWKEAVNKSLGWAKL